MSLQRTLGLAPGGDFKIEYGKIELPSPPVKQSSTQISCLGVITESLLELPCAQGSCHVAVW